LFGIIPFNYDWKGEWYLQYIKRKQMADFN
jgi:hypothetical protein